MTPQPKGGINGHSEILEAFLGLLDSSAVPGDSILSVGLAVLAFDNFASANLNQEQTDVSTWLEPSVAGEGTCRLSNHPRLGPRNVRLGLHHALDASIDSSSS
jgi:hypothetical protein